MYFEREKLTIKIPMNSAEKIGLRSLISKDQMDEVFTILRSGVKKLKGILSFIYLTNIIYLLIYK
jgi:RNA polymerase-interacting CarD/CdnL/TRCF family regulator